MKAQNRDTAWLQRYGELKQFKSRKGHCNVPRRFSDNKSLGEWVSTQRKQYEFMRQGKPSNITEFRTQALEKIGFQWSLKDQHDDEWCKMYEELKQFNCREGHCRVPRGFFRDNKSLGLWVNNQRTQYKYLKQGKTSGMTDSRIKKLENIGFQWSLKDPHDDVWYRRYKELKQFKCHEGHCNVPFGFCDNRSLGMWVKDQRTYYKHMLQGKPSSMTQKRIQELEKIGFKWILRDANDVAWLKRYEELKKFKCREGHCRVPRRFKSLGMWVHDQRTYYKYMRQGKSSSMTESRVRALEKIGFQWNLRDANDDAWCKMYEELKHFKCREGHCRVPRRFSDNKSLGCRLSDNKRLGTWVATQRRQYKCMKQGKSSSITESRIKKLENIEFQWSVQDSYDDA